MPGLGIGPGTAFRQDILAARPPAVSSLQGYFFFATDVNGGTLYQCTGSGWVQITGGLTNVVGGTNISVVTSPGVITVNNTYSLPIASGSQLGGIRVGPNLSIDPSTGVLSATASPPIASSSVLGVIRVGSGLAIDGSGVLSATGGGGGGGPGTAALSFVMSGYGLVIPVGMAGTLIVPFNCTITQVTMLADISTTAAITVYRNNYAGYPNTASSIGTGSIGASVKSTDTVLGSWITSLFTGDILRFNVNNNSAATEITMVLLVSVP